MNETTNDTLFIARIQQWDKLVRRSLVDVRNAQAIATPGSTLQKKLDSAETSLNQVVEQIYQLTTVLGETF